MIAFPAGVSVGCYAVSRSPYRIVRVGFARCATGLDLTMRKVGLDSRRFGHRQMNKNNPIPNPGRARNTPAAWGANYPHVVSAREGPLLNWGRLIMTAHTTTCMSSKVASRRQKT